MFLVWQGLGFVVPLIPIVFILLGQFLLDAVMGPGFYHSHGWSMAFMLLLSGVAAEALSWTEPRARNASPEPTPVVRVIRDEPEELEIDTDDAGA